MTSTQSADYHYQVGGSLPPNAQSYVSRQADEDFYRALSQGELSYVLSSRQMGKSSLRIRTMQRLQRDGVRCAVLDMTMIGTRGVTLPQWYASIVRCLVTTFDLPVNFREWWTERRNLSPVQCLGELLEKELLCHVHTPIVLFIDEIDATLQLDFSADDFFALVRAFYNNRADNEAYKRLTFALIGVAIPSELISDPKITPFNVGQSIVLQGFDWHEASPLLKGLQGIVQNPEATLTHILDWSGGQPFLTQKICRLLSDQVNKKRISTQIEESNVSDTSVIKSTDIEQLVKTKIIDGWEVQDHPEHLKTIRTRLLYNPLVSGQLLSLYQQLLNKTCLKTDGTLVQVMLRLSGIATDSQGELKIANPIYETVFDHHWVSQQLQTLRPYAASINQWSVSKGKNPENLLKGWELKNALAWAANKHLSEVDYRFLAASQEAEKQTLERDLIYETEERARAEFALKVSTEATQLLAVTKQQARAQNLSLGHMGGWLVGVIIGATSLIGLARASGSLQRLEWNLFDQFFRWRPLVEVNERVVIVTIDEPDIQTIGFPISDDILAEAIRNISRHQPRLIGLDIYRDRPIEPGREQLSALFHQMPNLIGIEKAVEPSISPPSGLAEKDQIGFADQLIDSDGKLRRALLSVEDSTGNTKLSFPSKIASIYLTEEGITPQSVPQNSELTQLGKQIIRPFRAYDGGYVRADAGGYQILLNYVGTRQQFRTFSLTQVLADHLPDSALRDRIVLIGSTSSTVNGVFITPYTNQLSGRMSGVTVHANVISALISAALEGRPLMRVWPKPVEVMWIFLWTASGALIAGRWRYRSQISILLIGITVSSLVCSAYGIFLLGWWVPVAPAAFGIVLAAVGVSIISSRQMERKLLGKITNELVKHKKTNPAVGQVAIAYFKQSESPRNQIWIDAALSRTERTSDQKKPN